MSTPQRLTRVQCNMHAEQPCSNCRRARSLSTGKSPCCRPRGQSLAAGGGVSTAAPKTGDRYLAASGSDVFASRQALPKSQKTWQEADRATRMALEPFEMIPSSLTLQSWQPTATASTSALLPGQMQSSTLPSARTTPRVAPDPARASTMSDRPPSRTSKAERERADARADSRRVQELKGRVDHLQVQLEREKRARTAAEERAQIAYNEGFKYGVQTVEARAFAMPESFLSNSMAFSTLPYEPSPPTSNSESGMNDAFPGHSGVDHFAEAAIAGDSGTTWQDASRLQETVMQLAAGPASSSKSSVQPQTRLDGLPSPADPTLQELRAKALASTAAFRLDRQAANDWLAQNEDLIQNASAAAGAVEMEGTKRKRDADGDGENQKRLRPSVV